MRKIKKGDPVIVIAGKDKGKKGVITTVLSNGKVVVEGVNNVKKHVKANPNTGDRGGIVLKTHPIDCSNVMLYDAASEKRSRVGIKVLEDGQKARYFKSSKNLINV